MAKARKSTGPKKRIKRGEITYTHQGCTTKKTEAKKHVDALRKQGYTATIVESGGKYCFYKGRKAKKSAVGATRKRKK